MLLDGKGSLNSSIQAVVYKTKPKRFLTNSLISRTGMWVRTSRGAYYPACRSRHGVVAFEKGKAAPGGMALMGFSWLDTPCSVFSQ